MGVGLELILFVILLGGVVLLLIRFAGKGRLAAPTNRDPRGTAFLRWLLPAIGLGLVVLVAINLQFCHQQETKMEKNTREDNSLDNVGKGENEGNHDGAGDSHRKSERQSPDN